MYLNALSIEGTDPGRVVNHSWGAVFPKTLVEVQWLYTYVKLRCLPAAELTKFPSLLLLLREGISLPQSHRSWNRPSPSDMFVLAVYLVVMTVLPLLLHIFSESKRAMRRSLYPHFSSLALPEEGKPGSVQSSHLFLILYLLPDQNRILSKGKKRTREGFVIWVI